MERLKVLKGNLRIWNREVFGKVEERKKSALEKVAYWDAIETQRLLESDEMESGLMAESSF